MRALAVDLFEGLPHKTESWVSNRGRLSTFCNLQIGPRPFHYFLALPPQYRNKWTQ